MKLSVDKYAFSETGSMNLRLVGNVNILTN